MTKKNIIALISLLLICGISYGVYLYNKPHKDIANAEAEMSFESKDLIAQFNSDKDATSTKLIDKVIEVSGMVTTIEESTESIIVILDNGIKCEFSAETKGIAKGQTIKAKGVYSGFDEMFNEITLIRCFITK